VWAELGAANVAIACDPEDLSAAVERSTDRVVLVDGPDELIHLTLPLVSRFCM
jgi:hypothetical protein